MEQLIAFCVAFDLGFLIIASTKASQDSLEAAETLSRMSKKKQMLHLFVLAPRVDLVMFVFQYVQYRLKELYKHWCFPVPAMVYIIGT